ncbi:MAG: hypothetical protein MZU97_09575 [Bacillus subtilis]|nr:hypothetical protein [Bacillus subtilis]
MLVMMILLSMNIIKVGQGFTSFLGRRDDHDDRDVDLPRLHRASPTLYYLVCILSAVLATLYLFLDFGTSSIRVEQGLDHRVGVDARPRVDGLARLAATSNSSACSRFLPAAADKRL